MTLSEINLDLNDIQPNENEEPRIILNEDRGLKVVLNFTNDRPSADVMVFVITVVNQGPHNINNFNFEASVRKPCKLRMLEASGTNLPGTKPFKQPTETINQILLLLNPTQQMIDTMVCIISYCSSEDPDPVKESFEIKHIPYLN